MAKFQYQWDYVLINSIHWQDPLAESQWSVSFLEQNEVYFSQSADAFQGKFDQFCWLISFSNASDGSDKSNLVEPAFHTSRVGEWILSREVYWAIVLAVRYKSAADAKAPRDCYMSSVGELNILIHQKDLEKDECNALSNYFAFETLYVFRLRIQ